MLVATSTCAAAWAGPAASSRVLLTGFDAFDHEDSNPSREIAKLLNGSCSGSVCIESLVLSVDTVGASLVAAQLSSTNSSPWAAVIHVGEDVPAMFRQVKKMHVELVAANVQSHSQGATGSELIPGAQPFLPATVNAGAIAPVVGANSASVLWHRDAGTYFCNEAFFRTTFAIRAANISAPSAPATAAPLLPAVFVHVPPPSVLAVKDAAAIIQQMSQAMVGSGAARKARPLVLLVGFTDRLGPDRGGAAALALNGSISTTGMLFDAALVPDSSPEAVASIINKAGDPLPWAGVLLVAEQTDRLQQGLALQVVGYTAPAGGGGGGDEDELVLPSTADLGRLNPSVAAPSRQDDAQVAWTRQNADFGPTVPGYYATLQALHNLSRPVPALLASLPFGDERSPTEDAQLIERVASMMLDRV